MPEGVDYGPQFTASVGKDLNYIGRYVYAFSGMQQVATSNVTHLSFTTGNGIIVGQITFCGSVKDSEISGGNVTGYTIKLNGEIAFKVKVETSTEDILPVTTPIIIPPFTVLEVAGLSDNADAGFQSSVVMTGIVYK